MTAVQRQLAPTDHLEIDSEENWDDDFEFQGDGAASNSGNRGSRRQRGPQSINQKLSIGSRAETEDWDAEQSTSVHLATSTATLKPPSPSRALRVPPDPETENWDDDFEDGGNSPQKSKPSPSFPPLRTSSLVASPHTEVHSEGVQEEPVESWDDDLDAEFGMADHEEEDRTVTARSRRAALSRAARMPGPSTPPPPTPKIPRGLAPAGAFLAPDQPFPHAHGPHSPTSSVFSVPATVRTTGSSAPLFASGSAHAYPSASARVFSLLPPSPQVHKERERRRLRKRSRPGDREDRERRREREGVFELVEVAEGSGHRSEDEEEGYRYGYGRSSIDSERDFEIEEEEEGRESAHGHVGSRSSVSRPFASRPSTAPTATQASQLQSVPATPTKQTLLSRIGSVKRWAGAGVRRKRGMSTGPDEIAGDPRHDALNELPDAHRTPRPHSSMSSFTNHDSSSGHGNGHVHSPGAHPRSPSSPATPSKSTGASPNADNGWFFRASSRSPPDSKRVSVSKGQGTRSVSRSTVDGPASVSPNSKSKAKASPSPRHISRSSSRSRAAVRDEGEDSLHASQRSGDRDAGAGWNGVGVGRRPGSRGGITGIGADAGRKGIRASLDFNASRTSLGMSMNILEAQERERERAREVYTPSPGVATPSRRAVGRGRGYSVDGKDQDGQTPAKLIKRKSLGFVQLRRATVGSESKEDLRDDTPEEDKESEGRQARYGGLGIGRAFGLGKAAVEGGEVDDNRKRRKSFSKLLKHRDPEEKDRPSILQTPPKVKEKEGSRGFMGSVRRISLVGKHKRTKSGSGFGLGSVPPSPSSPFFSRHASSGTPVREAPPLPYTLPSLAVSSSSQLSLRLAPSSSTHHLPLPPSRPGKRVVSTASSQGSSVMPASSSDASTSASSSRNPSASHSQMSPAYEHAEDTPKRTPQQVPATVKRTSSRRSRTSEEGKRRPSLVSSRPSLDFEARIRRSIDQEVSTGAICDQHVCCFHHHQSPTTPPSPRSIFTVASFFAFGFSHLQKRVK